MKYIRFWYFIWYNLWDKADNGASFFSSVWPWLHPAMVILAFARWRTNAPRRKTQERTRIHTYVVPPRPRPPGSHQKQTCFGYTRSFALSLVVRLSQTIQQDTTVISKMRIAGSAATAQRAIQGYSAPFDSTGETCPKVHRRSAAVIAQGTPVPRYDTTPMLAVVWFCSQVYGIERDRRIGRCPARQETANLAPYNGEKPTRDRR